MLTLSEQRKEIYKNPELVFCSPLALYALAERNPRPDCPEYVEVACERVQGVEGVILHLSPIDAAIYCREINSNGRKYEIYPYEAIDPRTFIQRHEQCLSLYIVYGYEAHDNKLKPNKNGFPNGLIYPLHYQFAPQEAQDHFHLQFSEKMTGWLDRLHKAAGLPDYQSLVYEQAKSSMAELVMDATAALQAAEYLNEPGQEATQCALFDPVEAQWRFVGLNSIR
jgi:hypothetical protein